MFHFRICVKTCGFPRCEPRRFTFAVLILCGFEGSLFRFRPPVTSAVCQTDHLCSPPCQSCNPLARPALRGGVVWPGDTCDPRLLSCTIFDPLVLVGESSISPQAAKPAHFAAPPLQHATAAGLGSPPQPQDGAEGWSVGVVPTLPLFRAYSDSQVGTGGHRMILLCIITVQNISLTTKPSSVGF